MNTKEILTKLKSVFDNSSEPKQDEVIDKVELSEEVLETEVKTEEVELAEDEESSAPEEKQAVEYATKLELQELAKTFMEALEAMQKVASEKEEVPQDLSSQKEVELSEEEVPEIIHSPEEEVSKKVNFSVKSPTNTIQSRIYNKLFN